MQILTAILYQRSRDEEYPQELQQLAHALSLVMDIAVRYTARTFTDSDLSEFVRVVDQAIEAIEVIMPSAMKRPKVHRLLHIICSMIRFGNAFETNGAV